MMLSESTNTHEGGPMWLSEEIAARLYNWANIGLIAGLGVGIISTILVVWMGNIKEDYLRIRLGEQSERTVVLEKANLDLQRKLAWRFLSENEENTILEAARRYPGHRIDLAYLGDAEASSYEAKFRTLFREKAKWQVQENARHTPPNPIFGLTFRTSSAPDQAAVDLMAAFQKAGMEVKKETVATPHNTFLELIVGLKPQN
jgi:hypothetical protein